MRNKKYLRSRRQKSHLLAHKHTILKYVKKLIKVLVLAMQKDRKRILQIGMVLHLIVIRY
jgi:hypothetical protein